VFRGFKSSAQAEPMKVMVGDLVALVGGSAKTTVQTPVPATRVPKTKIRKALELATPIKRAPRQTAPTSRSAEVNPEQLIPLADQDFR
jgi:hypothetical protein